MAVDTPKAKPPSRLGKGLSALIGEVEGIGLAAAPASAGVGEIAIADISANPAQPRRNFAPDALAELAASIATKGILQAILVRPDPNVTGKYQIIAGERRWRAAKKAGLKTIPALIRQVDELELLEVGIIENVQRTDLNPIEEAEAYGALMKRFGRTQEGLAKNVGKSRAHIANTLRLLTLPSAVRGYLREGKLSAGHARATLGAPDPEALADLAVKKGLSVRDVEDLARRAKEGGPVETKSVKAPRESLKDVDTQALEADLTRTLGLSVDIRHKENGGELRIKYRDLEQLDDVCRRLTARRG